MQTITNTKAMPEFKRLELELSCDLDALSSLLAHDSESFFLHF